MEASQHYDRAADLSTQGMDDMDAGKILEAVTEALLGYDAIIRFSEELEKHLE